MLYGSQQNQVGIQVAGLGVKKNTVGPGRIIVRKSWVATIIDYIDAISDGVQKHDYKASTLHRSIALDTTFPHLSR